jgi:hypothetical protein
VNWIRENDCPRKSLSDTETIVHGEKVVELICNSVGRSQTQVETKVLRQFPCEGRSIARHGDKRLNYVDFVLQSTVGAKCYPLSYEILSFNLFISL